MMKMFYANIRILLLILISLFTLYEGKAQYTPIVLETGKYYVAVTKDNAGNVYVVRWNAGAGSYEVARYIGGNPANVSVIYTGLASNSVEYPWGITVNSQGDVFVTDPQPAPVNGRIIKLARNTYTMSVMQQGGFYSALTIDASDNLLSMEYDAGTNRYRVVRYAAGAENAGGTVLYDGIITPIPRSSYPWGMVTDAQNNIFFLDFHERNGGQLVKLTAPAYTSTILDTGRYFSSLAIDASNNIYTIESLNRTAVARVMKYTNPALAETEVYSGLTIGSLFFPWGVTVMPSGDIYVCDGAAPGNGRFLKLAVPSIPSVTLSTTASSPVNARFVVTITFSEAVTGFTLGDFSTTNAGLSSLSTTDNITYTVEVIPLADGPVTVQLPANIAQNMTGNGNTASNTLTMQADLTAPYITSVDVPANGIYGGGDVLNFTVHFSENVLVNTAGGTPYINLLIGSTVRRANYISGNGTNALLFRYTVLNNDEDPNGILLGSSIELNNGTIRDAATNNALLALQGVPNTSQIIIRLTRPIVTISTDGISVTAPWTATIRFSEEVTGFTLSDIGGTNATYSNLQTTDNITYTVLVTPTTQGSVTVEVPQDVAQGLTGVGNQQGRLDYYYDPNPPVITSVDVPANGYYKAGDNLDLTVHFNETVRIVNTPFNGTLPVTIGSTVVQAAYVSGTNSNAFLFRYTVQNGDMDMDGIAVGSSLAINSHRLIDLSGNDVIPALNNVGNTSGVFVNTAHPSVTLSTTAPAVVGTPFTVTITFSEAVTGLATTDFTITNATLSNLQTTNNITYTILVTPAANGAISIQLPANTALNIANNGNAASNTLSAQADLTPPTITSVDVPANGYYKTGDGLLFTVHFNENVTVNTTGGTPYLNVVIGTTTRQAAAISGSGTNALSFRYIVQSSDEDLDGIVLSSLLVLNSGTIRDAAGNNASTTLNNVPSTSNIFVYSGVPSVILSSSGLSTNSPWTMTITFSEAVTGFTISDIIATNATLSNLQTTNNITYTVLVTPVANGAVNLSVPANVAQNIAGIGNTASSPLSYVFDAMPPVITSVTVPANGYYKAGDNLDFTVHFSETVKLSQAPFAGWLPVTIGSTVVHATYVSGSNTNAFLFRYTVQNGEMDMDGIAVGPNLVLNGHVIVDGSNNNVIPALNNVGNTSNVFVNTAHPSVTLGTTAPARVNAPFTVTITFSEAVTGLATTDFTVTNATLSNLQTTNNITYTVLVTPTTDGTVSIHLPADKAINIAGNNNNASNTLSVLADLTPPVIAAGQTFSVLQNSPAGTTVGSVTASDAAGTLQQWAITSDPSGGGFAINGSGTIRVSNASQLTPHAGTTLTLMVRVSDGLNNSTPTPVQVNVIAVNQPPTLDPIQDQSICATTETQTIQLTGISAGEPTQTWSFNISAGQQWFNLLAIHAGVLTYQLKPDITSGSVTITVTIKDNGGTANGGVDELKRTFTITVKPAPVISITSDKGTSVSKGDLVYLTATGGNRYTWANASGIISGQQSARLEIRPQANTTYEVTATNTNGCDHTASFAISVIEDFKIEATNIITPNGDGKNDKWVVRNLDSYPDNELKIFDRAGRLVYQRRNYNNDWDGRTNGNPLAEGVYYYILTIGNKAKIAKGAITIIRDRY